MNYDEADDLARARRFTSIRAEVCWDEDEERKYYRLSGDGWKDGEDTTEDPQFALETLPVGTVITLEEPYEE